MKSLLHAPLRSAVPATCLLACATILSGCNQSRAENANLNIPDLHTPTYVGSQLYAAPSTTPRHHARFHTAALPLISRHAPR
jgi:hypothetical protein